MPRVPKTLSAQLRQYYSKGMRPASEYGDDVFNFAADRLGRRQRALRDIEDLDAYAMEQQARGRYNPDELNALARQIEADRMLTEMDFDRYFAPRYDAENARRAQRRKAIRDLANYERAYTNLAAYAEGGPKEYWTGTGYLSNSRVAPEHSDFTKMKPWLGEHADDGVWQENADLSPTTLYEDIGGYGAYPDAMDWERAQAPIEKNDALLETILPEDTGPYYTRREVDNIHKAIDEWERLNIGYFRDPRRRINYGTGLRDWLDSKNRPERYR